MLPRMVVAVSLLLLLLLTVSPLPDFLLLVLESVEVLAESLLLELLLVFFLESDVDELSAVDPVSLLVL